MGRDCGYLALMAGIAGGAEAIVDPGGETRPGGRGRGRSARAYERGKPHAIVVVAEGAQLRRRARWRSYFKEQRARLGFELR